VKPGSPGVACGVADPEAWLREQKGRGRVVVSDVEFGRLIENPDQLEKLVDSLRPVIDTLGERDLISLSLRTSAAPERKGALVWVVELVHPLFSREA